MTLEAVEAVALVILGGGFTGVVYKSGQDRAEQFRARMLAAAADFLEAQRQTGDAIEEGVRSVDAWQSALARTQGSFGQLSELVNRANDPQALSDLTAAEAALEKLAQLSREIPDPDRPRTAKRAAALRDELYMALEDLEEKLGPTEPVRVLVESLMCSMSPTHAPKRCEREQPTFGLRLIALCTRGGTEHCANHLTLRGEALSAWS